MLGPVLIHQIKMFRPFQFFASTLICLNQIWLKAFETDGEPELVQDQNGSYSTRKEIRIARNYKKAAWLLCFIFNFTANNSESVAKLYYQVQG